MSTTIRPAHRSDRRDILDAATLARHLTEPGSPMHQDPAICTWSDRQMLVQLAADSITGERSTMSNLGQRIGLSRAATTALADRLTDAGYVTRSIVTDDRRATYLDITDAGMQLVRSAFDHHADA